MIVPMFKVVNCSTRYNFNFNTNIAAKSGDFPSTVVASFPIAQVSLSLLPSTKIHKGETYDAVPLSDSPSIYSVLNITLHRVSQIYHTVTPQYPYD